MEAYMAKNSDIELKNDGWLKVTGDYLDCSAFEFRFDAPERRANKPTPSTAPNADRARRALVHVQLAGGSSDQLALNFEGDYPGGAVVYDLKLKAAKGKISLPGTQTKTVFAGALVVPPLETIDVDQIDLIAEIKHLRSEIRAIKKKLGI
jgi:hypothetical protein